MATLKGVVSAVLLCCLGAIAPQPTYVTAFSEKPGSPQQSAGTLVAETHMQISSAQASAAPVKAVLDKYCVNCHNQRLKTAGLMLDAIDAGNVVPDAATWEKVVLRLRQREMPPSPMPRPDEATYNAVVFQLEAQLDAASAAKPNPGRVAVHRLNRTEYSNAIRDLLGIEIEAQSILPGDLPDRQNFDNTASVLSISPALLENYLSAAHTISRLAVGDAKANPMSTYRVPANLKQDDWMGDDLPFGSQGGVVVRHYFPGDGEYKIKLRLRRQLYDYIIGIGEPHEVHIRLDGALVKRFTIGGEAKGMTTPENFPGDTQGDPEWEEYMHNADDGLEVVVTVEAGMRSVGAAFVRSFWEPEGIEQPPQIESFARTDNELYFGQPGVGAISIDGPLSSKTSGLSTASQKLFSCRPKAGEPPAVCAREILSRLGTRAYRRPVTEEEVKVLLSFYEAGSADGGFEGGIQQGVERILAAPSFLFRVERPSKDTGMNTVYRLSDLDLASRLSFFLWSSIPDDELLDLAARQKLHEPAILENQVQRMLGDYRSAALADNFANQWLKLDSLSGVVPDIYEYPDFDENLRAAMAEETRLFVASHIKEDRPVMDLFSANYSFINERLAKHYQIPDVYGSHFRRVTFADGIRAGLLSNASILTVTSYPNRTSPVLRGKWIMNNLFGSLIPPPPPDVPALKEAGTEGAPPSIRARLELHRQNPVCAGCHQRMDPLGFLLENFDPLGKWRTASDGVPVDAGATLAGGAHFDGLSGLQKLLIVRKDNVVQNLTDKLLSYAIGRGLEHYDYPAVRKIMKSAAPGDYRWSALITGIVKSMPFTMAASSEGSAGRVGR
jgi:hypothetical protein